MRIVRYKCTKLFIINKKKVENSFYDYRLASFQGKTICIFTDTSLTWQCDQYSSGLQQVRYVRDTSLIPHLYLTYTSLATSLVTSLTISLYNLTIQLFFLITKYIFFYYTYNSMFITYELMFKAYEFMFTTYEHMFTSREHRILRQGKENC